MTRPLISLPDLGDAPLFSREQARLDGRLSDTDLQTLVRRGHLIRLTRGWYSTRVQAEADELHLLRTVAALRLVDDTVAANAHSAALVHGLPLSRARLDTVELARPRATHGRTRGGMHIGELVDSPEAVQLADLGVTVATVPVAAAVVGTGMTSGRAAMLVAGDHALRAGACTRDQLGHALERRRGRRGVETAREALPLLDPRHESPGETLTHDALRVRGWRLVPQVPVVVNGRARRIDLGVEGERVAIEYDGRLKYTNGAVLLEEKSREDDLREIGWQFVRVVSDDLDDPQQLDARVRSAVARARRAA
ncbi:hypothetical protein GCM10027055_04040 [Janibacter alkaliphilus]|uniref:Transcriptional regulator, AbiEi antitoxin, Type IV TA system n=1 Tax=Janibacter alkaliphilus TaxID=1069963 RepID=A0A852X2B1_9MICO|nr:hypothetical protein [Janibacter alkaliphilus]NYG37019.1 hypothetical protein [Janibacter alkaliphilus]